ncbi:hypothetical protein ASG17_07795 [Brevundimonas sp. Leaf363]|uniref:hypothetical protein n=1 Tax=Brevundimonas sp. Leaf363 TaxID=1736353 RepID=UPI0006FB68BF|nr:hypothetical protein [Brevundimonas sp. Leaf363]KQS55945.1 hypothetical protein ASG17_07795 [Brevundimonas sp. Leaf363]
MAEALKARAGVYVASRASIPERGQMWRDLRASGVNVTSTWIDEDGPGETADFADLWPRIQREVTSSERLVCYLEPDDFPIKGVLIEIGMALAAGVPVFIVAPDITLEGRTFRPLGSWVKHPAVTFCATVADAILALAPPAVGVAGPVDNAIRLALHRWLEWDFDGSDREYRDGTQHILAALSDGPQSSEPARWLWDQREGMGWAERCTAAKPLPGPMVRNVRALYAAHPQPSQPAPDGEVAAQFELDEMASKATSLEIIAASWKERAEAAEAKLQAMEEERALAEADVLMAAERLSILAQGKSKGPHEEYVRSSIAPIAGDLFSLARSRLASKGVR